MKFLLGSVDIRLIYSDTDLDAKLDLLLRGWPKGLDEGPPKYPYPQIHRPGISVSLTLDVLNQPPEVPNGIPFFQEKTQTTVGYSGTVSLFKDQNEVVIYFDDGVVIHLPPLEELDANEIHLHAMLSRRLLHASRLEDVLFAGLAPVLKRHGYALIHGFAASGSKGATLVIGPSGSGKTTVGLALIMAGWGYLANDVVLLKKESDGVYAIPVPGAIGMTARTLELLPGLQTIMNKEYLQGFSGKKYFPVVDVVQSWSKPARINLICMPEVCSGRPTQLNKSNKAIALAKLLESSLDRWDTAKLGDQFDFIKDLVGQAQVYTLESGEFVEKWSEFL